MSATMQETAPSSSEPVAAGPATTWYKRAWDAMGRVANRVVAYLHVLYTFYRDQAPHFQAYLSEFVSTPSSMTRKRREIRIASETDAVSAWRADDGWHVELPHCCVVCGESAVAQDVTQTFIVPDVAWSLWSPVAGGVAGLLAMWTFDAPWLLSLGLMAGFIVGYHGRRVQHATISFARCQKHSEATQLPHARLFSDFLIVRVGTPEVKSRFLNEQHGASGTRFQTTVAALPPVVEPQYGVPSSIPLEESDESSNIHFDDRPRMQGYAGPEESLERPLAAASDAAAGDRQKLRAYQPDATLTPSAGDEAARQTYCLLCGAEVRTHDSRCPKCNTLL